MSTPPPSSVLSARPSRPPWPFVLLAVAGAAFFAVPLAGLLLAAPWRSLGSYLTSSVVSDALVLSLVSSVAAAALALAVGVPLAYVLARSRFFGVSLLRGIVTLPMVLPPVVAGAALLFALGRRGTLGEPVYEATGLLLPYSLGGVIVANAFVATPLLVLAVEGGLRNIDPRYEQAAATLGAGRWRVLLRVTLPMLRPALVSGFVIAWARALGEFGATITFAGNLGGRTQTLPLAVFVAMEQDRDAAVAISLVLVAVSLVVLVALRDRWWPTRSHAP